VLLREKMRSKLPRIGTVVCMESASSLSHE
jgi:hypothetical protein